MAILFEKNFEDPNEKIVRQFTNCCGASDKGTEYGVVCRGCYDNIDEIMGKGDEELFENYVDTNIIGKFKEFIQNKQIYQVGKFEPKTLLDKYFFLHYKS